MSRFGKLGVALLALFALLGVAAPLLAADLPLLLHRAEKGKTWVLPCLFEPESLRGEDDRSIAGSLAEGDWAVFTPVRWGPLAQDLDHVLAPPGAGHPLGTDGSGRDVLSRLLHGARPSLGIGLFSVALYLLLGGSLGLLAGYRGGSVDAVVGRAIEVVTAFPTLLLALTVMGLVPRASMLALVAVIVVTRWTDVARLARGEARRLRSAEFVTAARALGAGPGRILARHVLPNALPPLLVAAAFGVGQAVLLESALSYLGFGVQPPGPSWGELISEASAYGTQAGAWWLALFPGLCLLGAVAGMNLAAEDLRRRLDPLGKRL